MSTIQTLSLSELSPNDQTIVASLLASGSAMEYAIPDNIGEGPLWETLEACCRALSVYRKRIGVLKPLIGRILIVCRNRPEIWQAKGYKNYDDFITNWTKDVVGIARSEAYACRNLAEKFPSLSIQDVQDVGYSKLSYLSTKTGEHDPKVNDWIKAAQEHTLDELKDIFANKGIEPRDESDLCNISFITTKAIKTRLLEFMTDPRVQAYCQTENYGKIIEFMMAECSEWLTIEEPAEVA